MRRWILLWGATLSLLFAAACGGGDGDETIDVGDGEVSISDDLPDDFPDDFPVYDGADVQGSFAGENEGVAGVVVTWTTGDDYDDVVAFYESEFEDGPWTTTSNGEGGGTSYWTVENDEDNKAGYVAVSGGDETTIIATVGDDEGQDAGEGDDDGSGDSETPDDADDGDGSTSDPDDGDTGDDQGDEGSADLPDEVELADGFPSDVELPDDTHIVSSQRISSGGVTAHTVVFYTQSSVDEVGEYFKSQFEGKGYAETLNTSGGGAVSAVYSENEDGTGKVVVLSAGESEVEGYNTVSLQVTQQ